MDENQKAINNISPTDQINWLSAMMSVDNDVNEKEYKVITSIYKESAFAVEDDIQEKTISIEKYFTDNIFNENLI